MYLGCQVEGVSYVEGQQDEEEGPEPGEGEGGGGLLAGPLVPVVVGCVDLPAVGGVSHLK